MFSANGRYGIVFNGEIYNHVELRQRLVASGYEPAARNSPDEFATFIQSDTTKWIALVEKTNMKGH